MANCFSGINVPSFITNSQNCTEDGRIVACAFIQENRTISQPSDASDWSSGISASEIYVYPQTRGSYPAASPTTNPGFGNQGEKTTGATHTVTVLVPGLKNNSGHWDGIMDGRYKFAFVVGADYDKLFYVDRVVSVAAYPVVTEEIGSDAYWQVTVTWNNKYNAEITDVPAGIFVPGN